MRIWRSFFPLIGVITLLFAPLFAPLCVSAQTGNAAPAPAVFSLIPLLEAAFNGELCWRPDWPADIPVDGFALSSEKPAPLGITLSNGLETYTFQRNAQGRLVEFPCFSQDLFLQVKAAYGVSGEILSMNVNVVVAAGGIVAAGGGGAGGGGADGGLTDQTWDFEFPSGLLLYDDNSPDGTFPPIKVTSGEAVFFVVLFESPALLSETWYDEAGNMLAYFKAPVRRENGRWMTLSLQTWDGEGTRSGEYAFDSYGNISEVRSPGGRFSALYRDKRPRCWEQQPAGTEEIPTAPRMTLQWDEQGLLVSLGFNAGGNSAGGVTAAVPVDASSADPGFEPPPLEYRYEYELDIAGNWIKRQDIAIISRFGVLAPRPGKTWTRRISGTED
jgi:hypothetical protein